jgi:Tol biopolymer transport system component
MGGQAAHAAIGASMLLGLTACAGAAPQAGPIVYQGPAGLVVVEADGSGARPALPAEFGGEARHADWSPDGSQVVFTLDDADGTRDIYVASAEGAQPRRLVDCVAPCRDADNPAWSPDGTRIAFSRIVIRDGIDQGGTLELADPATGAVEVVATTTTDAQAGVPRWSPDGTRLAVELLRWASASAEETRTTGGAIGVIDLRDEPAQIRPITAFDLHASYPDWHPTQDLIVFQAGDGDPFEQSGVPQQLYTIRPDGSALTLLTSRTVDEPWLALPAWRLDGSGILVTVIRGAGDFAFQTLDAAGGSPVDLVDPATGERLVGAHARQAPSRG